VAKVNNLAMTISKNY